jgi:hypothetical protein
MCSRIIAIYQMAGAIAMILVIAFNIGAFTGATFAFLMPIIGLCLVSLMAGIACFQKKDHRFFVLSKINFWTQTVQFSIALFGFTFYYGPYVYIGISEGNFTVGFELLTANFNVRIYSPDNFYVFVNAIPLVFLRALRWIERKPVTTELEHAFVEETPESL